MCVVAYRDGKLCSTNLHEAYTSKPVSRTGNALASVRKHESSMCFTESMQKVIKLPKRTKDVGETLSTKHAEEKKSDNRDCLQKILVPRASTIIYTRGYLYQV